MSIAEKAFFQFNKGINTEANPTAWPEGFSMDEENYELSFTGDRRKRKGLTHVADQAIGSGSSLLINGLLGTTATFYWNSVGGDSLTNFIILQKNSSLYIYPNETTTIYAEAAGGGIIDIIDLTPYAVPNTTTTQLCREFVDISFGRGNAVVVGKYLNPFLLKYVGGAHPFSITPIVIVERDFKGQPDGLLMNETSAASALTVQQSYNLQNRGWLTADLTAFHTAKSYWPSKNMIPWLGYVGKTTSGVAEADWTKQFSPDALVGQLFQDVSAPQGHLLMSPLVNAAPPGTSIAPAISTWVMLPSNLPQTYPTVQIKITTVANHSLIVGQMFHWNAVSSFLHDKQPGGGGDPPTQGITSTYNWDGDYQIQAVTSNTITFSVNLPPIWANFNNWVNQYVSLGSLTFSTVTNITNLNYTDARPEVAAFWQGRAFYLGINDGLFSSKVYFSQILEADDQYGACYQVADPTDQRISDIVDSDGGVLYIPEMATALHTEKVGAYLMVFATNGVWAIGPGQSGFFSPTSYSVRRVSDQGCIGKRAATLCEHIPYYGGHHDMFRVVQDPQTGQLNAENISYTTFSTLYDDIGDKDLVKFVYNDLDRRLYVMYKDDNLARYVYNRLLIYDTNMSACTKYSFGSAFGSTFITPQDISIIRQTNTTTDITKMLYSCYYSQTGIAPFWFFARMQRDTSTGGYLDNDRSYTAYMVTGYDFGDSPASRKQAPYIWVYSYKTETGFNDTGTDLVPIEASSTKMQVVWDFITKLDTGKASQAQEVYRHKRLYVSDQLDYDDGNQIVITKNLVRGSGRVLQLSFVNNNPQTTSWLLGWQVRYSLGGDAA